MKYICLLALLGTAACAPVPDDTIVLDSTEPLTEVAPLEDSNLPEECDAADYRPLIGTLVSDTVFPTGDRLRVYSRSDIVTQEYIPQRTNVIYDGSGRIERVTCG